LATSGIAETGTQVGSFSSRGKLPVDGEFTLAVRVERAQNGGWELAATYPGGRMTLGIKPPYADWVFNGDAYPAVRAHRNNARYEVAGQKGKTESFADDEPLVLLRVRAPLPDQAANHQPCDGVMVWFDHVNPKNAN
jgi:hypothetical protein